MPGQDLNSTAKLLVCSAHLLIHKTAVNKQWMMFPIINYSWNIILWIRIIPGIILLNKEGCSLFDCWCRKEASIVNHFLQTLNFCLYDYLSLNPVRAKKGTCFPVSGMRSSTRRITFWLFFLAILCFWSSGHLNLIFCFSLLSAWQHICDHRCPRKGKNKEKIHSSEYLSQGKESQGLSKEMELMMNL